MRARIVAAGLLGVLAFSLCRTIYADVPTTAPVPQRPSGIVALLPETAAFTGDPQIKKIGPVDAIVRWRGTKDTAQWIVDIKKPGTFEVLVTYACAPDSAGGEFSIEAAGQKITTKTVSTGGWDAQNSVVLGPIKIENAKEALVAVRYVDKPGEGLFALRGVALVPATSADIDRRRKAAAVPATQPAGDPLSITVDLSEAPELEDWMRDARVYCANSYPRIAEAIKTEGFLPPRAFNLRFSRDYQGVAATSGTHIFMSVKYVKGHLDDLGMVGHELVHVIQHYKQYRPGWLVEGIADYVRYYVLEPGSPRGRFNPSNSDYKRGYQPTAGLLAYVVKNYDKDAVRKFNTGLRDGSFKESMFVDLTGETADELWEDCKVVLTKAVIAAMPPTMSVRLFITIAPVPRISIQLHHNQDSNDVVANLVDESVWKPF